MTAFPQAGVPPLVTVTPFSAESVGPALTTGNTTMPNTLTASYPAANLAIYVPFVLSAAATFVKLFSINGFGSGNVDVGLYSADGTRIVSSGSIAFSTNTTQEYDIDDTTLSPGLCYLAIACASTNVFRRATAPVGVTLLRAAGVLQQSSAFPLPATATFETLTNNYIPVFGATTRSVV